MTNEFTDITDRLGKPKWFDVKGYPRYSKFKPDDVGDIYADYVALVVIGCQNCDRTWLVAVSEQNFNTVEIIKGDKKTVVIKSLEFPCKTDVGSFHYGDPPSHVAHDHAGSTMNSVPIRIVEFWQNRIGVGSLKTIAKNGKWKRLRKYEGFIKQDWADDILHIQRRQAYMLRMERKKMQRSKKKWQVYPRAKRQHAG